MDPAPDARPAVIAPAPPALPRPWPRAAQAALAVLLGASAVLLAYHAYGRSRAESRPTELERGAVLAYRIDLNRAGHSELLQLPGVGESMARRIEEYRREHGPFQSVGDLVEVRGVGPETLRRLGPWVTVESDEDPDREADPVAVSGPLRKPKTPGGKAAGKKGADLAEPVDVNRAPAAGLQRLPGIGPVMARRILEERRRRPFRSVDDLRRVPGIGPKKLESLRPYVTVGGPQRLAAAD